MTSWESSATQSRTRQSKITETLRHWSGANWTRVRWAINWCQLTAPPLWKEVIVLEKKKISIFSRRCKAVRWGWATLTNSIKPSDRSMLNSSTWWALWAILCQISNRKRLRRSSPHSVRIRIFKDLMKTSSVSAEKTAEWPTQPPAPWVSNRKDPKTKPLSQRVISCLRLNQTTTLSTSTSTTSPKMHLWKGASSSLEDWIKSSSSLATYKMYKAFLTLEKTETHSVYPKASTPTLNQYYRRQVKGTLEATSWAKATIGVDSKLPPKSTELSHNHLFKCLKKASSRPIEVYRKEFWPPMYGLKQECSLQ